MHGGIGSIFISRASLGSKLKNNTGIIDSSTAS